MLLFISIRDGTRRGPLGAAEQQGLESRGLHAVDVVSEDEIKAPAFSKLSYKHNGFVFACAAFVQSGKGSGENCLIGL